MIKYLVDGGASGVGLECCALVKCVCAYFTGTSHCVESVPYHVEREPTPLLLHGGHGRPRVTPRTVAKSERVDVLLQTKPNKTSEMK